MPGFFLRPKDRVSTSLNSSTEKGDSAKLMYVDWITPVPGENGNIIVKDKNGEPVVVVGKVDLGKVVFNGSVSLSSVNNSYDAEVKPFYGLNAALAEGAVEWMTGVKLNKKRI